MKKIITIYGIILSVGLLVNNYMEFIPVIDKVADNIASGWIAITYIIIIVMLGIDAYVEYSYKENSYEFINAFAIGTSITILGATVYSLVSTCILLIHGVELNVFETIIYRILKYGFIGMIPSVIIPLVYRVRG